MNLRRCMARPGGQVLSNAEPNTLRMSGQPIRFAFVKGSFLSFSRGDAEAAAKVPALSLSHALRNRRVLGFLAVWFGVNILFGVGSIAIGMDGASVAWQTHIGGFFAGLVLFSLFDPVPRAPANAADASSSGVSDHL